MEQQQQGSRRRRLVLIASPYQGHMTPMLQLARALHAKSFSITIVHSKLNSPDPSNHPDFIFLPLSDNLSSLDAGGSIPKFLLALNDNCKAPFYERLTQMIGEENRGKDEGITIIHDYLMFFAGAVAADLNLPAIVFRTCSAAYFPAFLGLLKLRNEGWLPVQDSMLQEMVPGLHPLRYKDLPFFNSPVQDFLQLSAIVSQTNHPSAVIWNTIEFLEHSALSQIQQHYKVPLFAVGPLHKIAPKVSTSFLEEDMSCIPWLDKQAPKSVIYVSLGSLATLDEKVLVEMAWGLANSNQPFLWAVRPGCVHGSEWIEFLPDALMEEISGRGLIVKWAPQKQVLAHVAVGGFWSHCGWNSTFESISEGIPMLCQPFIVDQQVNSRYITYVWKIGIELEYLERGVITNAIKSLLVDKEGEEMRHRVIALKEKVKDAVHEGGSSHNSLNDLVQFILSSRLPKLEATVQYM